MSKKDQMCVVNLCGTKYVLPIEEGAEVLKLLANAEKYDYVSVGDKYRYAVIPRPEGETLGLDILSDFDLIDLRVQGETHLKEKYAKSTE